LQHFESFESRFEPHSNNVGQLGPGIVAQNFARAGHNVEKIDRRALILGPAGGSTAMSLSR
jgi:hypothetical protein